MGICCERNLIASLDNKTKVYYKPKGKLKNYKCYRIELEGDVYKIDPNKAATTETDEIFKSEGSLLTFLKDEKGIKTGEHRIRIEFERLLQKNDHKKLQCESLIFQDPQVNEDNKEYLFRCLAGSIYHFDKSKERHYLKGIYVPWQINIEQLRVLFKEQIKHLAILVQKG